MAERRYRVTWADLGCPTEPGRCEWQGKPVQVKAVNIAAADGNPDAICIVICSTPVNGPETCAVGSVELPD
jgi:hypothetical protein